MNKKIIIEIGPNLKECILLMIRSSERKGYHINWTGEAIRNAFGIKIDKEILHGIMVL